MRAWFSVACLLIGPVAAAVELPADVETHDDGRAAIQDLYEAYLSLEDRGWTVDVIVESRPPGTEYALPVIAIKSPNTGAATWILSGIHGEEPAGPNAIAAAIEDIAKLGDTHPVVVIPVCNPHGYVRNWRYLNAAAWSEDLEVQSVGDSSHLLPDTSSGLARAASASSPEAKALTRYILESMDAYPPLVSLDLHEDNLISEGYVYSQGVRGAADPLAAEAIRVLQDHDIPVKLDGFTRFNEPVADGIIGPVEDSSIDELMSAGKVMINGKTEAGPGARTVLVFETPAGELALDRRVAAHAALLSRLTGIIAQSPR